MADPTSPAERTRRSLHAVAEHVLGAALHSANGHIGLRATPGGFGTPPFQGVGGERRIAVAGLDLVVTTAGTERRGPLTTIRDAAALAATVPGAPADVYTPATPLDLDGPLEIDPVEAERLAAFFATVSAALEQLRAQFGGDTVDPVQLWPEHFDIAVTIDEVNYGGSPGDDEHPEPYLYVGPWSMPDTDDPFWNEPFGASTTPGVGLEVADAVAFFTEGRSRLAP